MTYTVTELIVDTDAVNVDIPANSIILYSQLILVRDGNDYKDQILIKYLALNP